MLERSEAKRGEATAVYLLPLPLSLGPPSPPHPPSAGNRGSRQSSGMRRRQMLRRRRRRVGGKNADPNCVYSFEQSFTSFSACLSLPCPFYDSPFPFLSSSLSPPHDPSHAPPLLSSILMGVFLGHPFSPPSLYSQGTLWLLVMGRRLGVFRWHEPPASLDDGLS